MSNVQRRFIFECKISCEYWTWLPYNFEYRNPECHKHAYSQNPEYLCSKVMCLFIIVSIYWKGQSPGVIRHLIICAYLPTLIYQSSDRKELGKQLLLFVGSSPTGFLLTLLVWSYFVRVIYSVFVCFQCWSHQNDIRCVRLNYGPTWLYVLLFP